MYIRKNGYGKRKFVFLDRLMINGNSRLLFQKTCPSMYVCNKPKMTTNNKLDCTHEVDLAVTGKNIGEIGKRRMPTSNLSSLMSDVTTN